MPEPISAGIAAVSSIGSAVVQGRASSRANRRQQQAADASIAEQRRQFDELQRLLNPYVQAGTPALQGLLDLSGLGPTQTNWTAYAQSNPELMAAYQAQQAATPQGGGVGAPYGLGEDFIRGGYNPAFYGDAGGFGREGIMGGAAGQQQPMSLEQFAQQYYSQNGGDISQFQDNPQERAYRDVEQSAGFQALARQGEDAILQNASATGGLRGGNTQGALARFRPALLDQFIERQFGRLGGIASMGQNAAAGVGAAGVQMGQNVGNTLIGKGQASAANAGAQGQIFGNLIGQLGGMGANAFGGGMIRAPSASLMPSVNNAFANNAGIF